MTLLTKKELAQLLKVDKTTIWRMVKSGQLKPLRTNPMIFDADCPNVFNKVKKI